MASGSDRSGTNPSSSHGTWYDVVEIVDEDGKQYRVRWAGKNPKSGKPWPLEWVPNSHCSADLIRDWEKKKVKSKKQGVKAGAEEWRPTRPQPEMVAPKSQVAFKRPPENRDTASTSKPPNPTTRKGNHSIPSGSVDNAAKDSTASRGKKLATAVESTRSDRHGGQSTAAAPALPKKKGHPTTTKNLPSHPPLEEIEMWVPTPNAKFGPPKRKRTASERRDSPKKQRVDKALPAKTPVPTPIPLPSLPQPLSLTESQIFALREEEEESQSQLQSQSQSQPTSNQPGGIINDSATRSPLPQTVTTKDDTRPTNPNVNNGRGSETSGRGASQSNVSNPVKQALSATDDSPGYRFNPLSPSPLSLFHPNTSTSSNSPSKSPQAEKSTQGEGVNTEDTHRFKPQIPVFNVNPSASALSSSKPSQTEKLEKIGPPQTKRRGTSSTKQRSPSTSEPPRTDNGLLAKRRNYEALVRLNKLLLVGKKHGLTAKDHPTSETSQSSEQPHVVLKRVMDGMESPNGSQVTHLGNSANEMSASAPSGGNRQAEPSKSQEVVNKSGQDVNLGWLSRTGGVLAAKVLVPSSEDEVPPTASNSTQSQSHDTLPHTSLDSQLAAALDLLHKKSEEISELRMQVNMLRSQSTEQASNGALHGKEATGYLATEVQTDRDNESYKDWNLERTQWNTQILALQDEANTLRGEKERAIADVDFFRAQYQKASDFASSTRSENDELSARAALAESQATKGVALVRATFEGRVAKLEAEVQKYKALSEMLTERARRTDDDVRCRAALAPEFERELRQLEGRFNEVEAELEETKDELSDEKRASSKLRREIARLESSREQAADVGRSHEQEQDHMLWSDEKDDEDYNPSRSPSSSPRGGSDGSSPRSLRQEDHDLHNEDDAGLADGEIEQLDSFGLSEGAQSSIDDMVYLCGWRPGEPAENCDVVVSTKEELHEHVVSHHLSCH